MITIEIKDADEISAGRSEIEIYCDSAGFRELQRQLDFFKRGETHVHLATLSWAGNELAETVMREGNVLVHQVTIYKIPESAE